MRFATEFVGLQRSVLMSCFLDDLPEYKAASFRCFLITMRIAIGGLRPVLRFGTFSLAPAYLHLTRQRIDMVFLRAWVRILIPGPEPLGRWPCHWLCPMTRSHSAILSVQSFAIAGACCILHPSFVSSSSFNSCASCLSFGSFMLWCNSRTIISPRSSAVPCACPSVVLCLSISCALASFLAHHAGVRARLPPVRCLPPEKAEWVHSGAFSAASPGSCRFRRKTRATLWRGRCVGCLGRSRSEPASLHTAVT